MKDFYVALGANLPFGTTQPVETLRAATHALADKAVAVQALSRLYRTPSFPNGLGPDYVNAVAHVHAELTPHALLACLHEIEADFGRERRARWGGRTLDLDLLACGNLVAPDRERFQHWHDLPAEAQTRCAPAELILPHPRVQDRGFVLIPWRDIAPDWRHPVLGATVAEMCDALAPGDRADIVALEL